MDEQLPLAPEYLDLCSRESLDRLESFLLELLLELDLGHYETARKGVRRLLRSTHELRIALNGP